MGPSTCELNLIMYVSTVMCAFVLNYIAKHVHIYMYVREKDERERERERGRERDRERDRDCRLSADAFNTNL